MRRLLSAPRAAQIELAAGAGWAVLGLTSGVALASQGGTVGTLWGTTITEHPPALLIGLNVLLGGLLFAVPFLAVALARSAIGADDDDALGSRQRGQQGRRAPFRRR